MLLLCIKIFLARIIDVTLGTMRTVLVVRGKKFTPAIIAFCDKPLFIPPIISATTPVINPPTPIAVPNAFGLPASDAVLYNCIK